MWGNHGSSSLLIGKRHYLNLNETLFQTPADFPPLRPFKHHERKCITALEVHRAAVNRGRHRRDEASLQCGRAAINVALRGINLMNSACLLELCRMLIRHAVKGKIHFGLSLELVAF